ASTENGAPPGHVTFTHAFATPPTAAGTAAQMGVAVPMATQKLGAALLDASAAVVLAHTWNCRPAVVVSLSSIGLKCLPSAGDVTVRSGGVVSTVKVTFADFPKSPLGPRHVAST